MRDEALKLPALKSEAYVVTELVFDKKGGAIIVIFPTGEFYCNANPDNRGRSYRACIQELMKDDAWKSRLVEELKR